MLERGRTSEPFSFRCSNADPEHSVDGRHTEAGHASLVPMWIFLALAAALIVLYQQLAA